jgi:hypothetical protein
MSGIARVEVSRKITIIKMKISIMPSVGIATCRENGSAATAGRSNGNEPCASHSATTEPTSHKVTASWTPRWTTTARTAEPSEVAVTGRAGRN